VHTEKTIKMDRKQAQLEQEWRNPMKREDNTGKKRPKTLKGLWRVVTYEIMFRLRQKVVENEEHEEIFHLREK
jgi:hypothetical protein